MPENLLLAVLKCAEEPLNLSNPLNSGHLAPEKSEEKLFQIEDELVSLFILNQRNQEANNEEEKNIFAVG